VSLGELCGEGWTFIEPPEPSDEASVIGRCDGEKIRAGVRTETVTDSNSEMHYRYRSGQYDLDVKIDFDIGRGQVKVERAEGYENE